ncbi:MAG: hypothetical protein WAO21_08030 [Verrucomicrobiia bacterium]
MPEMDDITLLRQYAEGSSDSAFATLVGRQIVLLNDHLRPGLW